jgi:hypothetical protein
MAGVGDFLAGSRLNLSQIETVLFDGARTAEAYASSGGNRHGSGIELAPSR